MTAWSETPESCAEDARWSEDPTRCEEEDCGEEGTERWERGTQDGPLFYCPAHFAERAEREAVLLTRRNRNRRDR